MNKLAEQHLPGLDWLPEDVRWTALLHYIERVESAGVPLVSHADRVRIVPRHLQPSLEGLAAIPEQGQMLDIGSGGGFPAIPVALAKPALTVSMVESNVRKSAFLQRVSRETLLTNIQVLNCRVEFLGKEYNQYYDLITARAVADLPELIKWTRRLLRPTGRWLLWKGRAWRDEGSLEKLKVCLIEERPLSDGGRLVLLEKLP